MALPVEINSGAETVQPTLSTTIDEFPHGFHGPFKKTDEEKYFVLLRNKTNEGQLEMYWSTAPATSFAEADAANAPTAHGNVLSLYVSQNGDDLHIAIGSDNAGSENYRVEYARFDMSAGTNGAWQTVTGSAKIQTVNPTYSDGPTDQSVCSGSRSNGDILISYNGETQLNNSVEYTRPYIRVSDDGGDTWGSEQQISADTQDHIESPFFTVVQAADRAHIFYLDADNNDMHYQLFTSSDTLGASGELDTTTASFLHVLGHCINYNDGSTDRIRVAYLDSNGQVSVFTATDGDTPNFIKEANASDADATANHGVPALSLCFDDIAGQNDTYLLYSQITNDDIYSDVNDLPGSASWATDIERFVGTFRLVNCNVYIRNGRVVIGYVTGETVADKAEYNEIDLRAVAGGERTQGFIIG